GWASSARAHEQPATATANARRRKIFIAVSGILGVVCYGTEPPHGPLDDPYGLQPPIGVRPLQFLRDAIGFPSELRVAECIDVVMRSMMRDDSSGIQKANRGAKPRFVLLRESGAATGSGCAA